MNDNKKLIEGIRETGDPAHPLVLRGWAELSVNDVAVLRAYFEKAHTPTDDEREALAVIELAHRAMDEAWPGSDLRAEHERLDGLADGFRRSEVPEPSADDLIDTRAGLALANAAWQEGASTMLRSANQHGDGEPWSKPVSPYSAPLLALSSEEQGESWVQTSSGFETTREAYGHLQAEPSDAQLPEPKAAVVDSAYLDRVQTTAEPIYRSTSEAERASKFLVSDLAQHVVRLVEEVRRLRQAEAQDERIEAWHYVADHEAFKACYDEELPLIDSVLARITDLHELESTVNELAPAPTLPFEPSDAQVQMMAKHIAHTALDWTDIEGPDHDHSFECSNWTAYQDDARAALRAAAAVTEQGEGRG